MSIELKWGLIIGGFSLLWLYLSYYLGMHRALATVQIVVVVNLLGSFTGYFLFLRELLKKEPETSFREGVRTASLAVGVVAIVAALSQFGYFYVINPGFTEFMVAETKRHFSAEGISGDELAQQLELARKSFSVGTYAIQSALGAIFIGLVSSAMIMGVFCWRRSR